MFHNSVVNNLRGGLHPRIPVDVLDVTPDPVTGEVQNRRAQHRDKPGAVPRRRVQNVQGQVEDAAEIPVADYRAL